MQIRQAGQGDKEVIAAIEYFDISPWSAAQIEEELLHKLSITLIVTGEAAAEGIGWCSARFVPPECELLKISVLPRYRRQGVATLMLSELIRQCCEKGCMEMYLEARQSAWQARTLYRSIGFEEQGRRKAYYTNPAEDAILMKMVLGQK